MNSLISTTVASTMMLHSAVTRQLLARGRTSVFTTSRRTAILVPKLGTEAEMKAEAVEQIRARIAYQKALKAKHHTYEEEVGEMWRWVNFTFYLAIPLSIASTLYTYLFDEHPHRIEGPLPEYMNIRTKEFPWECSNCDLLDLPCWKECRAEKGK